mmetsp:Transcript_15323/g.24951  ORF Transcript_15323/g.24951 Transcript_15323/m.24951 type:complete len:221 (-) Transcript_15323:3367-4029(-)
MCVFQKSDFPSRGVTSLILNINTPAIQIHMIFAMVNNRLQQAPATIDLTVRSPGSIPVTVVLLKLMYSVAWSVAIASKTPVFTAGGRSEAEIATPTRLDVLFPRTDKATPTPEGMAMHIPTTTDIPDARLHISEVGHVSPLTGAAQRPPTYPTAQHMSSPTSSENSPFLIKRVSNMVNPKVTARIGPINGLTSIDATITTTLFVTKPIQAKILATMTNIT